MPHDQLRNPHYKYASTLSWNDNCLANVPTIYNQTEYDAFLEELPGQKFTLDQQCEQINGPGAEYCGVSTDIAESKHFILQFLSFQHTVLCSENNQIVCTYSN